MKHNEYSALIRLRLKQEHGIDVTELVRKGELSLNVDDAIYAAANKCCNLSEDIQRAIDSTIDLVRLTIEERKESRV